MGALAFGEAPCRALDGHTYHGAEMGPGALNLKGGPRELEGKPWKTPGQTHTQPTSFHSNQRKGIEAGVLGKPPQNISYTRPMPRMCSL